MNTPLPLGQPVQDRKTGRKMHIDALMKRDHQWIGSYCCRWPDDTPDKNGVIWDRRGVFQPEDLVVLDGPLEPSLPLESWV